MSGGGPPDIAREVSVRVTALARAMKAGRVPGLDEEMAADLTKVARAAENFAAAWHAKVVVAEFPREEEGLRKLRHDLRSPISHMLGYLELVEEGLEDGLDGVAGGEAPAKEVGAWLKETRRLHGRVDDLHAALEAELREPPDADWHAPTSSRPSASARPGPVGELLIVDDDPEHRELLRRHLERQGHQVIAAVNGEEALERARKSPPELVLLDVLMPVLDGYETLRRLKKDERLCRVPVLMLSGLDDADTVVRCLRAGAEDHLPKPAEPAVLVARVRTLLERKRLDDRERAYVEQLRAAKRRVDDFIDYVVPIGARLAAETDTSTALRELVAAAQRFTGADAAHLYLVAQDGSLQARGRVIESLGWSRFGPEAAELDEVTAVAVAASRTPRAIYVSAVESCERFDHTALQRIDAALDYRTRDCLAVALRGPEGEVRGVLELFNLVSMEGGASFDLHRVRPIESLGTLAAVALARGEYEDGLRARIEALEVQVDAVAQAHQVAQITESDYFRELKRKAARMRSRRGTSGPGGAASEVGASPEEEEA